MRPRPRGPGREVSPRRTPASVGVVDGQPIHERGVLGVEEAPVERRDLQRVDVAAQAGEAHDGLQHRPEPAWVCAARDLLAHGREGIGVAVDRMPGRDDAPSLGVEQEQDAVEPRDGLCRGRGHRRCVMWTRHRRQRIGEHVNRLARPTVERHARAIGQPRRLLDPRVDLARRARERAGVQATGEGGRCACIAPGHREMHVGVRSRPRPARIDQAQHGAVDDHAPPAQRRRARRQRRRPGAVEARLPGQRHDRDPRRACSEHAGDRRPRPAQVQRRQVESEPRRQRTGQRVEHRGCPTRRAERGACGIPDADEVRGVPLGARVGASRIDRVEERRGQQ